MTLPLQKNIFLMGEGDAWFKRNERFDPLSDPSDDPLLPSLLDIPLGLGSATTVAEIGCGQGLRLQTLANLKGWSVYGLDPSAKGVSAATQLGITARIGTADNLPYTDNSLDLLIFGFCLYLCDRNDLFKIAAEAHRVLKNSSWLAILDFWSPHHHANNYRHHPNVKSYKDNVPAMFTWHPSYTITNHKLMDHSNFSHTDSKDDWIAATIIRRHDIISQ